jgi:glutamate-5-semialdehyde dehydrogenase
MNTHNNTAADNMITQNLKRVKEACRKLVNLSGKDIDSIILKVADLTQMKVEDILIANKKDLSRMDPANPKYDRLLLNKKRIGDIIKDLRKVAGMESPLNKSLDQRTLDNGLFLEKISVPLGVVGIVYESRPNVTFDVFALNIKAANATVLKGSRDAHFSNIAIVNIIQTVLDEFGVNDACFLAPSERKSLNDILQADEFIDLIIPRGGQGLINFVRENSKVPVIETGAGIVHVFFDKEGDFQKGERIIYNSKSRRVSVCNAMDTLIIHQDRINELPLLLENLASDHECLVYADENSYQSLSKNYPQHLLKKADESVFGQEFLSMKMSVKSVPNIDSALDHISKYSSKHSEAIVSENMETLNYYRNNVDAAVVYTNTSTAFTDGAQFGMGAEIGISTQKIHARGPMALNELTSYKWLVTGDGHIRP